MGRKNISEKRREELVWALFDCLTRQGHEQVTVKAIAARAGVAHGAIHYFFNSKDEIVSALVEAIAEKYGSLMDEFLESVPPGPDAIEIVLDFLVDEFIFEGSLNRVFYNLVQMGFERESVLKPLQVMLREYRERLARVLSMHGTNRYAPSQASVLVAVIEGFALQWIIEPEALDRTEVRQQVSQVVSACLREPEEINTPT
ncbi:MAG: TetR/AcrR family transcriptional regulator [Thermovirgaceae bacterium]